jgi:hypothetical protein
VLLRGSDESQTRTLTVVGLAVILFCTAVAGIVIAKPFQGPPQNTISIAIDTPFIVQGVAAGTAVMMHGVQVGELTAVASLPTGGARLKADVKKSSVAGLTDAMGIDFRPANYFGVTGINITPGAGGQALRDGIQITTVPRGNYTLQALLTRLGQLSTGVVTPQLVDVIDRATRYGDGMTPLIETVLITANSLAQVQDTPTVQLLNNTTGIAVAFPSMLNETTNLGNDISRADDNWLHEGIGDLSQEVYVNEMLPTFELTSQKLFGSIGTLESAHVEELLPLVNGIQSLTDVVPPLVRPEGFSQMLVDLRSRFERMYGGTPEQRALQVRIALDPLPGVAAPLGVMGGPP